MKCLVHALNRLVPGAMYSTVVVTYIPRNRCQVPGTWYVCRVPGIPASQPYPQQYHHYPIIDRSTAAASIFEARLSTDEILNAVPCGAVKCGENRNAVGEML